MTFQKTPCAVLFAAGLAMLSPSVSPALTAQQLCAKVYEDYGVRSELCEDSAAPDQADPPAPQITEETRESHIFFPRGGATLDDKAQAQIALLAQVLETPLMSRACLRLIGHSDASGPAKDNLALSLRRAEVVADALKAGLTDGQRVAPVEAQGETQPLSGQPGGSVWNRRVEIQARDCR